MKGLTHFIMGMAIASCFAAVIDAAVTQQSLLILLGGIFGILPDTLDFRIAKYFEPHEEDIDPDPDNIDPTEIARRMAQAIDRAWEEKRTVQIQFHTIKMSADLWQQYTLEIDQVNKKIICRIGPLVTTGKSPLPGTKPEGDDAVGEWPFKADVIHTYDKETYVDIFSGPDFAFVPDGKKIRVDFIPFHRKWTHSLTVPFLFMPLGFLLYGWTQMGVIAAFVILFSYWGHVMLDQTGMMGSNLFPPFTKKRSRGMGLARSNSPLGNFSVNVMSVFVTLWNINYFSPKGMVWESPWAEALGITSYGGYYAVGLLNFFVYYYLPFMGLLFVGVKLYKKYVLEPEEGREVEMTREEKAAEEMIKSYEEMTGE